MAVIVMGISWCLRWNISCLFIFYSPALSHSLALLFMQSTVWWQYQSLQQISNNVASGCDSIWIFRTCLYSFTLCHMCCMGFCASFPLLLFDLYTTTIETYAKLGLCLTLNVCSNILTHILVRADPFAAKRTQTTLYQYQFILCCPFDILRALFIQCRLCEF